MFCIYFFLFLEAKNQNFSNPPAQLQNYDLFCVRKPPVCLQLDCHLCVFLWKWTCITYNKTRRNSVSIASGYWLDNRAIEIRSPAEAKDFSSNLCVQAGSGAQPAPCPVDTGGPFPWVKCGRGMTLTTHPHLVPRLWMSRSYTASLPRASTGVLWDCFLSHIMNTFENWYFNLKYTVTHLVI
jgi:hypothetical protein